MPDALQRSLYLHAGLLEIADKGFSEIAQSIDAYAAKLNENYEAGNLDFPIDSISLSEFIEGWSRANNYALEVEPKTQLDMNDLIQELNGFGITTVGQLKEMIPDSYVTIAKELGIQPTTIYGLVRDWMIIQDVDKIMGLGVRWVFPSPYDDPKDFELYERISSPENFERILRHANDGGRYYYDEDEGDPDD